MKKTDYLQYFAGKKITLMGLGLLGRGLGDAKFLAECGAILTVTDLKTAEQLKTSVDLLNKFISRYHLKPITYNLGGHKLEDFKDRDVVVRNADVRPSSPFIAEARKNNIPVKMSTSWFAKIAMAHGVKIIGITGTRGKSTVTHLIYEILKMAKMARVPFDINTGEVFLGGNVRGVSTLPLLKKLKKGDIVVMELDSWQLQGFGEEEISPNVAVFTTFYPDHLNYYKGDMKAYFADKINILINQKKGDILIIGEQVKIPITYSLKPITSSSKDLPKTWKLKMPGEHNRYNAALAVATTHALGVKDKIIKKVTENFAGVPGRLQLVRTWKGRKIYNDTTATTPEATRVALEALGGKKNIVLICGGADKILDMSKLIEVLPKYCKEVIWLPGTGTERLKSSTKIERVVGSMNEAVSEAIKISKKGDVVLLSPAFASFGLFKNEFDRGEQFNKLVAKLK